MTTDDRYDIDLGAYLRGLLHWWWVIVVLAVLGAAVGAALSRQPPQGLPGDELRVPRPADRRQRQPHLRHQHRPPRRHSRSATPRARSPRVASQVGGGETVRRLRANGLGHPAGAVVKTATAPINIVNVRVQRRKPARAAAAANAIAAVIVDRLAAYDTAKIALLTSQVAGDDKRLAQLKARNDAAQRALSAIAAGGGAAATKAMASAPYLGIVQSAIERDAEPARRQAHGRPGAARGARRRSARRARREPRRPRARSHARSRPTQRSACLWAWSSGSWRPPCSSGGGARAHRLTCRGARRRLGRSRIFLVPGAVELGAPVGEHRQLLAHPVDRAPGRAPRRRAPRRRAPRPARCPTDRRSCCARSSGGRRRERPTGRRPPRSSRSRWRGRAAAPPSGRGRWPR